MRRWLFLFALAAVLAPAQAVFRTEVRLVRLLVSVKDPKGNAIGTLTAKDFRVTDSSVPQQISVFEHNTDVPLSVSLLIDTSGSTAKDLKYEIASFEKFLKALFSEGNDKDAAALYSFNSDVTLLSSFTRRESRLSSALRGIKPEGATALYDAISLATGDLSRREGRHVLVAITDGGDTFSKTSYQAALEAAHRADAVLYNILVVPVSNDAGRNTGGEHALETLAQATGGRVFAPNVGAQLDQAFADILKDLRTQYLIGYYPKDLPRDAPKFHPVKVLVDRGDLGALQVRTRSGYYGDASR